MKVRLTPTTIPGGDKNRVRVLTQASEPGKVLVSLSIQGEAIGDGGIIRDHGPPFVIKRTKTGPVRVDDLARQRDGFLPVMSGKDSHLVRFGLVRPDRDVVAVTGCGNLLCNSGVEARTMGVRAGVRGPRRAGILVQPNGRGRLLEGSRLETALSADKGTIGKSPDRFVITGPLLVAGGRAFEPDAREFADMRHLILPAYVKVKGGRRIDFGFDWLNKSPELARRAAAGKPVSLPLVAVLPKTDRVDAKLQMAPVAPRSLRAALVAKGYREAAKVEKPGTFRIDETEVTIAFLPGIYPHHALAIDGDGVVRSVIVTGRSNREGTTVRELAAALAKGGARDAILLDNGGDVGLLRRKGARTRAPLVFEARPAEADRARAWPTRACLIFHAKKKG